MFMSAMILIRLTSAGTHVVGQFEDLVQRTVDAEPDATPSSPGSMWTSEARSRSAWVTILLTTCTTGASSSTSSVASKDGSRSLPGLLDSLESLNQMIEATDRSVVVVDSAPDL